VDNVPTLQSTQGLSTVINTRYLFFSLNVSSPYIQCVIDRAHGTIPQPITCVSFRETMNLVQTFEEVTWGKTVSVSELERNRK